MSNINSFNNPFMLGFEEFENMLLQISKGSENFPPYNIEQLNEEYLRLTLAVAGYKEQDLEVSMEENQLTIRGKQFNDPNRHFIHKGISSRSFIKSFVLADGLEIKGAILEDGLLKIDFKRKIKQKNIQKITIKTQQSSQLVLSTKGDEDE
ncbi:MAG: Hsp20 family protein [Alphaproteobacteria bacterium]|nr:Hsp20 family protein [Alphaproteobacteria bacterium]